MIFFSIDKTGRRSYAAAEDVRAVLNQSGTKELIEILGLFDAAASGLPKNFPVLLRKGLVSSYLAVLMSQIPSQSVKKGIPQSNYQALLQNIDAVYKKLSGSKFQEPFRSSILSAINAIRKQYPDLEMPPDIKPEDNDPGSGNTAAEIGERMTRTAIDSAMKVVAEIEPLFNQLPPEISGNIGNASGFGVQKFSGMMHDFVMRVINSMGSTGFQSYYSMYGNDDQSGSITNSVAADFSNLGMAFLYQIMDAAVIDTKQFAADKLQESTIINQAKAFDRLENGFWRRLEKNKASAGWAAKAKAIGTTIARSYFKSKAAQDRLREKSMSSYAHLYTRAGYEALYSKFIQIMKSLSNFSPWQSMLNSSSRPGTIERGAMDRLTDVISQAAAAKGDKDAAAFLVNFKPDINEFAMNAIAEGKIEGGQEAHAEDKRSDAFVNYLVQEIESAAGSLNPNISSLTEEIDSADEANRRRNPAAPSAPTPGGNGGVGTTAFVLGALILLKYGEKTNDEIAAPEERLPLNSPEERVQLNVPEAQGTPAAPAAPAPKAPAAPGG